MRSRYPENHSPAPTVDIIMSALEEKISTVNGDNKFTIEDITKTVRSSRSILHVQFRTRDSENNSRQGGKAIVLLGENGEIIDIRAIVFPPIVFSAEVFQRMNADKLKA